MADRKNFSEVTNNVLYGLEHNLFEDDLGRSLLNIWSLGLSDAFTTGVISNRVHRHRLHEALRGVPFAEPPLSDGPFVIGLDPDHPSRLIRVPVESLAGHCLCVATTGAGKTTRSRVSALQLGRLVQGMWLWDLRKREWRVLKPYFARMGIDLIVVPGRQLKLNPLQVPFAVDPSDWCATVADMLVSVFGLPPRASKLIQSTLFILYRQAGVLDGSEHYPTLFDLFEAVRTDKTANPQSRSALIDSLEPVLHSLTPAVLGYHRGWSTRDLARFHIAFELAGLSETDKNVILNSLLVGEFTSRIAQGFSNVPLNLWSCVDESQRLCVASGHSNVAAIADSLGLVRGAGVCMDLSVQSTHGLSPQVLSNTNVKLLGRCGSFADVSAAGSCMALNADQVRYVQQQLRTGEFICQLGTGDFRKPFLCRIPPMNLKPTTDHSSGPSDLGPLKALPTA